MRLFLVWILLALAAGQDLEACQNKTHGDNCSYAAALSAVLHGKCMTVGPVNLTVLACVRDPDSSSQTPASENLAPADPVCRSGLLHSSTGACCPPDCEDCYDGPQRPTNRDCSVELILRVKLSCGEAGPPCYVPRTQVAPLVDPFDTGDLGLGTLVNDAIIQQGLLIPPYNNPDDSSTNASPETRSGFKIGKQEQLALMVAGTSVGICCVCAILARLMCSESNNDDEDDAIAMGFKDPPKLQNTGQSSIMAKRAQPGTLNGDTLLVVREEGEKVGEDGEDEESREDGEEGDIEEKVEAKKKTRDAAGVGPLGQGEDGEDEDDELLRWVANDGNDITIVNILAESPKASDHGINSAKMQSITKAPKDVASSGLASPTSKSQIRAAPPTSRRRKTKSDPCASKESADDSKAGDPATTVASISGSEKIEAHSTSQKSRKTKTEGSTHKSRETDVHGDTSTQERPAEVKSGTTRRHNQDKGKDEKKSDKKSGKTLENAKNVTSEELSNHSPHADSSESSTTVPSAPDVDVPGNRSSAPQDTPRLRQAASSHPPEELVPDEPPPAEPPPASHLQAEAVQMATSQVTNKGKHDKDDKDGRDGKAGKAGKDAKDGNEGKVGNRGRSSSPTKGRCSSSTKARSASPTKQPKDSSSAKEHRGSPDTTEPATQEELELNEDKLSSLLSTVGNMRDDQLRQVTPRPRSSKRSSRKPSPGHDRANGSSHASAGTPKLKDSAWSRKWETMQADLSSALEDDVTSSTNLSFNMSFH